MDKNTLVGFALIGAVVIGFSIYNRPSQEEWHVQNTTRIPFRLSPKKKLPCKNRQHSRVRPIQYRQTLPHCSMARAGNGAVDNTGKRFGENHIYQ